MGMVERGTENITSEATILETRLYFYQSLNKEASELAANVLWFLFPLW